MFEVYFLFGLAFVWLVFATIEDIRSREIYNWVNFSLVLFALGFRFFYSLFELNNFSFFFWGVLGALFFYVLSLLFYKVKLFAGGDQKLLFSLGAVLPIYPTLFENTILVLTFILIFLLVGSLYGIFFSFYFAVKNKSLFKKELKKQFGKKRKIILLSFVISILFLISSFFINSLFAIAIFFFVLPYLYLFFVSVDDGCMVKKISTKRLTEGDWIVKDIRVGGKTIEAKWEGLSKEEVKLLKQKKEFVFVRYGLQFAPVFLISFILIFLEINFHFFLNFLGS